MCNQCGCDERDITKRISEKQAKNYKKNIVRLSPPDPALTNYSLARSTTRVFKPQIRDSLRALPREDVMYLVEQATTPERLMRALEELLALRTGGSRGGEEQPAR